jgi:hypothetical protein
MQRLRSEFDGDRQRRHLPLEFETADHRFEFPCSVCGTKYYFDENGKLDLEIATAEADENPFVCAECQADEEMAAHGN